MQCASSKMGPGSAKQRQGAASRPGHEKLPRAEPDAGAQELLRIHRVAVDPRFVVQMRTGRAAGGADRADHLSDPDKIADPDVDLRQMTVAGRQAVAVVDLHHAAIAAGP